MTSLLARLATFTVGVPAAVSVLLFLPQKNHLVANLIVIILSALGAAEFGEILKKKNISIHSREAALLGSIAPLGMTLTVSFGFNDVSIAVLLIAGALWLILSCVFASEKDFKDAATRIAAGFAVILYPGAFMAWIVRMSGLPRADMILLLFLLLVIANDSAAWVAGLLFGKGNRGFVKVSPNKSIAGFVGGLAVSTLIGMGTVYVLPEVFTCPGFPSPAGGLIFGFLTAAAATLGDLGESALKRSSNIKDSGSIIPGRGGVLDSIDSLCFAAPVYYGSYCFFFTSF
ncbi:MAG: phosphatidate cytidylyltransferase [Spirochaetaceae bacterium]|jgi:phosphatidate cytidylyltransferase|nr:phosphatidate cytidylyltransferase [Spirochaetaceae bacterium]